MAKRSKKNAKIRAEFRKKHESRTRPRGFTRAFQEHGFEEDGQIRSERISGKGELTRKRTVVGQDASQEEGGFAVRPQVDRTVCRQGRVLTVHGLASVVQTPDGALYRCATRRLLKTLSTDQRHVVVAGDQVWFRPEGEREGFIERVEPRRGVLSRTSRGRQHVIVANVDQLVIVASAAEPALKPHLIDRFLATAEKNRIRPLLCINKIDLVAPEDLQPLVGVYGQMGYPVLLVSAQTGWGLQRFGRAIQGQQSVVAGQSGVGKSSLLNQIQPDLHLRVQQVSSETQKGRHTTSTGLLVPLSFGGYVVDTPGIRQFQLWDVVPQEIANYYRDLRTYIGLCRFPDCTHTHEDHCAVKDAVADGRLDARRYESYCHLLDGEDY